MIKGYVRICSKKVPVTWEWETNSYVYNVRMIKYDNEKILINQRLFDDKVSKKEIEFFNTPVCRSTWKGKIGHPQWIDQKISH